MTLLVALAALATGIAVGRRLPRRGRHARPWLSRTRVAAWSEARRDHPSARPEANVVIDLRAWVPEPSGADAAAVRLAFASRRT